MTPRSGRFGHDDHVRPLLEQRQDLVVDVPVADAVGERVDAGPQQPLRVVEREDVRGHPQTALVRLVDDRPYRSGVSFLYLPVAVVDPDLDDVDLLRGELLHGLAAFVGVVDPVRRVRASRLRHRDAAARGEEPGRARQRLRAHLERALAGVLPEAHRRAHAVVGAAPQVLGERLPRLAEMRVRVDDRGHDRLPGQATRGRPRRHLHVGGPAHLARCGRRDDDRARSRSAAARRRR